MSEALRGGTTDTDDRDGAVGPDGNAVDAGANAGATLEALQAENERLKAAHQQSLAEKTRLENLERENADLRARGVQPSTPSPGADRTVGIQRLIGQRLAEHALMAETNPEGSPDSVLLVGLYQQNQMLNQQLNDMRGTIDVPSENRARVSALRQEYAARGEQISAATAAKLLAIEDGEKQAQTTTRQQREQERAEEAAERAKVGTRTIGVSASELPQKTMTIDEYDRRTERMTPEQVRAFDRKLVTDGTVVS